MITIKNIKISRNWGTRPTDNAIYCGMAWAVKKGEPYDLVQFSINELNKPYFWRDSLALPCGQSEEEIRQDCEDYIKQYIEDKDIAEYKKFLEYGEKWGWD